MLLRAGRRVVEDRRGRMDAESTGGRVGWKGEGGQWIGVGVTWMGGWMCGRC